MAERNFRGLHVETTSIEGAHSQHVTLHSLLTGELQQFNRLAGGPICQYAVVTSDATGLNVASGPAILYGIVLIAAGTMASVYDGATATGNVLIPSTTATVMFNGAGILCNNGITCDWTSGTWLVLYAPEV
jgi:hypothetical protein